MSEEINFDEWPEGFYSYGEIISKTPEKLFVQACHPETGELTIEFSATHSWSECGCFKLENAFNP